MSINGTRKSRFGADSPRHSYTPTVSRALIEDTSELDSVPAVDRLTPSDFVPAGRDSWDDVGQIPAAGDSDLPLPPATQNDADVVGMRGMPRMPRDSLDLGSDSIIPLPMPDSLVPEPMAVESTPVRAALVASEHPMWTRARTLLGAEQRDAAADVLERLCLEQPNHEPARAALLHLSIMLGRYERVGVHTAWLLRGQLQSERAVDACLTYQKVRTALPSAPLPEGVLVAALSAADATGSGAVVLDATNMLLKLHAASPQTPRALLVAAKHQFMSGANEAGVQTLRFLVANYPQDGAADPARRKLAELGYH